MDGVDIGVRILPQRTEGERVITIAVRHKTSELQPRCDDLLTPINCPNARRKTRCCKRQNSALRLIQRTTSDDMYSIGLDAFIRFRYGHGIHRGRRRRGGAPPGWRRIDEGAYRAVHLQLASGALHLDIVIGSKPGADATIQRGTSPHALAAPAFKNSFETLTDSAIHNFPLRPDLR